MKLDGGAFASAWLNTALASSDDSNRPALFRTVVVEQYHERYRKGVQLLATDSHLMLGAFVPIEGGEADVLPPTVDEAPTADEVVVIDVNLRLQALLRYVLKEATMADKEGWPGPIVQISIRSNETDAEPTLSPELDRLSFMVETDAERIALPVYEGGFPNWRSMLTNGAHKATKTIGYEPELLGRFGKLTRVPGPIRFDHRGPNGLVSISAPNSGSYLFGGLAPWTLD